MAGRVDAVAFDVLETLLDLDPIGVRLEEVGQPASVVGPALHALPARRDGPDAGGRRRGVHRDRPPTLRTETRRSLSAEAIAHVLEGFAAVPAVPDRSDGSGSW